MVPEDIPAETQLLCYFLMKYSFPGTQNILALDLEGKESRQIFFSHLAFEHLAGKGRNKSGWLWERPSSLRFLCTSQWCNILLPSSHMQTELLGFTCLPVLSLDLHPPEEGWPGSGCKAAIVGTVLNREGGSGHSYQSRHLVAHRVIAKKSQGELG